MWHSAGVSWSACEWQMRAPGAWRWAHSLLLHGWRKGSRESKGRAAEGHQMAHGQREGKGVGGV